MIKFRKAGTRGSLALAAAGAAASVGLALGLASAASAAPASGVGSDHLKLCAFGNYTAFADVPGSSLSANPLTQEALKGKCTDVFFPGEPNQLTGIAVGGFFNRKSREFFISVLHVNVHNGVTVVTTGTTGNNGNDAKASVLEQAGSV
jgi:hypothetical protein